MGLFGGKSAGSIARSAEKKERARLNAIRIREAKRTVFQTTEGDGIMEAANISLGYDDEDEDDLLLGDNTLNNSSGNSQTGLVI